MYYADEILSGDKTPATSKKLGNTTGAVITGAVVGLLSGGLYAWFNNKKYLPWMLAGAAAGGILIRISLLKK